MTEEQLMVRRAMQEALDRRDNGGPPPSQLRGSQDDTHDNASNAGDLRVGGAPDSDADADSDTDSDSDNGADADTDNDGVRADARQAGSNEPAVAPARSVRRPRVAA